jgi:hypothetical protein
LTRANKFKIGNTIVLFTSSPLKFEPGPYSNRNGKGKKALVRGKKTAKYKVRGPTSARRIVKIKK